jgi:hypothetical protein
VIPCSKNFSTLCNLIMAVLRSALSKVNRAV